MSGLRRGVLVAAALALVACDDDDGERDGGAIGDGAARDAAPPVPDVGPPPDAGPVPEGATRFVVRIENVAPPTFPTALGAGVAMTHAPPAPLFVEGAPDRGQGLEALAEDGDPRPLAEALGATVFAGLAPGGARDVIVDAWPDGSRLSFATMLVESNDVFLAPAGDGIPLFDEEGRPLPARDVTSLVEVWNAGTEIDQAPGLGPMQAHRQAAPGTGPVESSVRPFADGTRTLPLARDMVRVRASVEGAEITLSFENVSEERGLFVTPISPLFWMVHGDSVRLFEEGAPAPDNGLETLAEEGDARPLANWAVTRAGVLDRGITLGPVGTERFGMAQPGERFEITVRADAAHPRLSVATAIPSANDAFLAFPGQGIRLLGEDGRVRAAADLEREILRALTVWDAGTEANEVPGAGVHAGARPGEPSFGAPDPHARVRRYDDATNDLDEDGVGDVLDLRIRNTGGSTFEVTVTNTSGDTPFPLLVTPFAYAVHEEGVRLFEPGGRATPGIEELSEDCVTGMMHDELASTAGVVRAAVASVPDGSSTGSGPLRDGDRYVFMITADPLHPRFNLFAMPYPSNDMFVALAPEGLALLDASGEPRSDEDIMADVRRTFRVWDAGTESNQAGASGRDAVPLQAGHHMGAPEGDGTVRREADPIYTYPAAAELVRVVIVPQE